MAEKRRRYDRCIFKDADGKACKAKRLRDCPWAFCSRHETLKLVEMRAKMRDEEAERQRIPLAQAIFVKAFASWMDGVGGMPEPSDTVETARDMARNAFLAAEEFFAEVKDRSVG